MTDSGTGNGSTTATNSVLRVGRECTFAQRFNPVVPRLIICQRAKSNGRRLGVTANTAILVCWLIVLIVMLVALEVHIRGLTLHSSLSCPCSHRMGKTSVAINHGFFGEN